MFPVIPIELQRKHPFKTFTAQHKSIDDET